jgi:hypothetical protein
MNNPFIEQYRKESPIFYPQAGNVYKPFIQPGDPDSMESYLIQLTGGTKKLGEYYDPVKKAWVPGMIPELEKAMKEVSIKFKTVQQQAINYGNRPPSEMPPDLLEEEARIKAKLTVAREEATFLKKEILAATMEKKKAEENILPPQNWGSIKFNQDNIVKSIGGMNVSMNQDKGLLCIDDSRSPYNGMEVWRFKSQIFKPMSWEYSCRKRLESEAVKKEKRPEKAVPYPEVPVWNKSADKIEYPGYHAATLRKCLKTDNNI